MKTLFVSLFDSLTTRNFPSGTRFERRTLKAAEAANRIDTAREARLLHGVTAEDLVVQQRALASYKELLAALAQLPTPVPLSLRDFESQRAFVPLEAARVDANSDLLVISCTYELVQRAVGESGPPSFRLQPERVTFDLFAAE